MFLLSRACSQLGEFPKANRSLNCLWCIYTGMLKQTLLMIYMKRKQVDFHPLSPWILLQASFGYVIHNWMQFTFFSFYILMGNFVPQRSEHGSIYKDDKGLSNFYDLISLRNKASRREIFWNKYITIKYRFASIPGLHCLVIPL